MHRRSSSAWQSNRLVSGRSGVRIPSPAPAHDAIAPARPVESPPCSPRSSSIQPLLPRSTTAVGSTTRRSCLQWSVRSSRSPSCSDTCGSRRGSRPTRVRDGAFAHRGSSPAAMCAVPSTSPALQSWCSRQRLWARPRRWLPLRLRKLLRQRRNLLRQRRNLLRQRRKLLRLQRLLQRSPLQRLQRLQRSPLQRLHQPRRRARRPLRPPSLPPSSGRTCRLTRRRSRRRSPSSSPKAPIAASPRARPGALP
jgi:hypothetical protein